MICMKWPSMLTASLHVFFYFILFVLVIEDLKRWKAEEERYENFLLLLSGLRMEKQYLPKLMTFLPKQ